MSKKRNIEDEDKQLFRESMSDVRRLKFASRISGEKKPPPPRPLQKEQDEADVLREMLSDPIAIDELETGDELLFCRPGIQHRTFQKLRRGEFAIEKELDLHGYTVSDARQALAEFLVTARHRGIRCVRIIHGKGHGSHNRIPILKSHVNHWLRQRDEVLAFCSATRQDGGTGAVYVILKKTG